MKSKTKILTPPQVLDGLLHRLDDHLTRHAEAHGEIDVTTLEPARVETQEILIEFLLELARARPGHEHLVRLMEGSLHERRRLKTPGKSTRTKTGKSQKSRAARKPSRGLRLLK